MASITPPRRDESIIDESGRPTLRFIEYLESVSSSVIEITRETSQIVSLAPDIGNQSALIRGLSERLEDMERSDIGDVLNGKVAAISAKVNLLIEELIEAVNKLATAESANKSLLEQQAIVKELELLNTRFEEAFETDIEAGDL